MTDDSILLQVAMTSEAEMLAISATASEALTATPSFDSVKGMTLEGTSSLGWRINQLTGYADLQNEGQLSVEVETGYLTSSLDTSTGDDTTNQSSTPQLIGMRDGIAGSNFGSVFVANKVAQGIAKTLSTNFDGSIDSTQNHQYDAAPNSSTPTNSPTYAHSVGKGEYTRINVGWAGSKYWMALDGKLIIGQTYTNDANMFEALYILNWIGSANNKCAEWYIRNLQISNRRPTFPVHPQLKRVITWSDSLFERTDSYASATQDFTMDNTVNAQIRQSLANNGLYCGWLDSDINDGMTIYTGTQASTVLSTITAQRPDVVVMQFGTNDTSAGATFSGTDFLDTATHGYKALVDALDAAGVQHIIICTVPPRTENTEAIQAAIDEANTAIKTLPAYNSKVVVADVFTVMGGRNASTDLFFDTPAIHMNGKGMYLHGQEVAKQLLKVIGT